MAQAQVNPFFTPTQISGCQLWLDAADPTTTIGNPVSQWNDKSASRLIFTQASAAARPSIATTNPFSRSVFFTTAQTISSSNQGTLGPQQSWFVVFNSGNGNFFIEQSANTNSSNGSFLYGQNGDLSFIRRTGGSNFIDDAAVPFGTSPFSGNISYIASFVNDNTSNGNIWRINGSSRALTFRFPFATLSGNVTDNFYINSRVPANIYHAEILIYDASLSLSQVQQIEGYLAWKWGLQGSLPATHPYKVSPIPPLLSPPTTLPRGIQTVTPITWFPNQISGLQLWFDAADNSTFSFSSGSNIQTWQDKSPNKYSVGQANVSLQPTLASAAQNSLSGVQLTTAAYLFTACSNIPNFSVGSQTSVFIAARNASANSGWNIVNTIWFTAAAGGTSRYHFSFNQGATAGTTLFMNNALVGQVTSNATPPNSNAILGFTASGTSTTIHTNGSSNGYGGVSLPDANNATYFMFGDARNSSGTSSNIMIFEMVGYNRQVTTSERQQIEGYLAYKWGLLANLPQNQPYKSFPPFVPSLAYPPRSTGVASSWQPSQISGLSLWLDAADLSTFTLNGTSVSAWRDKSGNNRNTTNSVFSAPTLQNKTVRFTGTNGLRFSTTFPSFYDIFTVAAPLSSTASWRTLLQIDGGTASHIVLVETGSTNLGNWFGSFRQFGTLTWSGTKSLLFARLNSNLTMNAAFNGTETITSATAAVGAASSGSINLGNANGSTQAWGDLNEFLLYNPPLTLQQRQQVEGYLAWKWGLQGSLPANHPYKKWPPSP